MNLFMGALFVPSANHNLYTYDLVFDAGACNYGVNVVGRIENSILSFNGA